MKNVALANLIRKGLLVKGVIEDQSAFGVEYYCKSARANVIGLAYLGTGREISYARGIFEMARQEKIEDDANLTIVRIDKELGAPGEKLTKSLALAHMIMSATEIANRLEAGTFEPKENGKN